MASISLNFLKGLNNRELAIGIWLLVGFILSLISSKTRESLLQVVKAFFAWKLILSYLIMLVYITLIVIVMNVIGIWRMNHLSLTIMWAVFVAYVMLFNFQKANSPDYFSSSFKDNLKALVFFEFIVNLYVFPLWVELLFIPFMVIIAAMLAISESNFEYRIVKKFLNFIMTLIGLIFMIYAGYNISTNFRQFATLDNLETFYLPILLSIGFIPFVYLYALYCGYEMFFVRLGFFVEDKAVLLYAKRKTICAINLNLWKLNKWAKYVSSAWRFKEKKEIDVAIRTFKSGTWSDNEMESGISSG
jgi:hypothetical protein